MRTIRCPDHEGRDCVNCGGTGRVEADENGHPWWEQAFAIPTAPEVRREP